MITRCPNDQCGQTYKITPQFLGQKARCKRCQSVFMIEEFTQPADLIELPDDDPEGQGDVEGREDGQKRRTSKQIMLESVEAIVSEVNVLLPSLQAAWKRQENESNTRLLIDRVLQKVLGYAIEDIKTEQRIEGRRADYLLSIRNEDKIVGEVKKIGMPLRDTQIFQASSHAAFAGIPWVFLTNGLVWQLFHVGTGEKIDSNLVFTVDLKDGIDAIEAEYFYLISKWGLSRKGLLDRLWKKMSALSYDNMISAILTEDIISKLRTVLNRRSGANVSEEEVRTALENNLFQLA